MRSPNERSNRALLIDDFFLEPTAATKQAMMEDQECLAIFLYCVSRNGACLACGNGQRGRGCFIGLDGRPIVVSD